MESNQVVKIKDILESKAFVAIAVSTAILLALALIVYKIKRWIAARKIPEYEVLNYKASWESIKDSSVNTAISDSNQQAMFLNHEDHEKIQDDVLQAIDQKIDANNQKRGSSDQEAHFVFYGAAGNGKTSLVRGVANHIKDKGKNVEIISASTSSMQKDDTKMSLMSPIEPAEKLKTLFQIARNRASSNKYVILKIEEMDLIVGYTKMTTVLLQELSPTNKTANSNIILVGTTNNPDLIKNMRDQEQSPSNPATSQGAAQSITRRLKLVKIDTPDQNTVKALLNQHIKRAFGDKEDTIDELSKRLSGLSADAVVKFARQVQSNASLNTKSEILQKADRYLQDNDKQTPVNRQRQAVVSKIRGIYQKAQEDWKIGQSDKFKIDELEDHLKDDTKLSNLLQTYQKELQDCNQEIENLTNKSEKTALSIENLEGYGPDKLFSREKYNESKHYGIAGLQAKLSDARKEKKDSDYIDSIIKELAKERAALKIRQKDKQKIDGKLQKLETATNAIEQIKDELENYQELSKASTQLDDASFLLHNLSPSGKNLI